MHKTTKSLDEIIDSCRCVYGHDGGPRAEPCRGKTELRTAMTKYHFEGEINSSEDPNKDFYACEEHYEDYCQYWQEMWNEYWRSVL
jgi:hypothetical protein